MRTGEVEANLCNLNRIFGLPYIDDLITAKKQSAEQATIESASVNLHTSELQRLRSDLETAASTSTLPEETMARAALDDLLIRIRKNNTSFSSSTV